MPDNNILKKILKELRLIKSDVGILKSDVGILKSDVGVLKSDVGTLKSDGRAMKSNIESLKSGLETVKRKMATKDDLLATEKRMIDQIVEGDKAIISTSSKLHDEVVERFDNLELNTPTRREFDVLKRKVERNHPTN